MTKEVMKFQVNDNEFQLQKCLNCFILLLSLFEFIMKKKFHTWNSANKIYNKMYQRCADLFCPINPYFWGFCLNVKLKSLLSNKGKCNFVKIKKIIFVGSKCQKLGIWVWNFRRQMFDFKSVPLKQDTYKISLRLRS